MSDRALRALLLACGLGLASLAGCAHRSPYATTDDGLALDRVVLYRSGIGYFERRGAFDGELLTLKVRKDQVNDLLKSLTVVDTKAGKTVSVSMPLDPQSWANAALAMLAPGSGNLAEVLDALRGAEVVLHAGRRRVRGRIVMVEAVEDEPQPQPAGGAAVMVPVGGTRDHKITLLRGREVEVVRLSQVRSFTLRDGDLALQLHRSLDASAGEGMFQQVEVQIRLDGARGHDLMVSYVVAAPVWKPTYRVVLPDDAKGKALLQAWAVVDNVSGEEWREVGMSLTAGEPIAFRYDLHTPRNVERADLSEAGSRKRATVALGESSYDYDAAPQEAPMPSPAVSGYAEMEEAAYDEDLRADAKVSKEREKSKAKKSAAAAASTRAGGGAAAGPRLPMAPPPPPAGPQLDNATLARSVQADAKARSVSGLTSYELGGRVTVPDGTSTMVALVNESVEAEQTFLFRPGGAGIGYEVNPYRVVRFRNTTPFVLEPGPITIYAGGSFVGEGISEAVGAGSSATIPFAVEPSIMVTSQTEYSGADLRIVRIVRGVLECESFQRRATTWNIKGKPDPKGYRVLVRHGKAGAEYVLQSRPDGVEDLPDGYLIPVKVDPKSGEGSVKVVEQTPSRITLTIWDGRAPELIQTLLSVPGIDADTRAKLQPIVALRQEIGRIDAELDGRHAQQAEYNARAEETRDNLAAIQKDPRAGDLRQRLSKRLEEFTSGADKIGRQLVELQSKRMEKRIELEDRLQTLDLTAPAK